MSEEELEAVAPDESLEVESGFERMPVEIAAEPRPAIEGLTATWMAEAELEAIAEGENSQRCFLGERRPFEKDPAGAGNGTISG